MLLFPDFILVGNLKMKNKNYCFYFTHYAVICEVREPKRSIKVRQIIKQYGWQQSKSLFELETTPVQLERMKEQIWPYFDSLTDLLIIYPLNKQSINSKEIYGRLKYVIRRIF